jgi:hypothetical protein
MICRSLGLSALPEPTLTMLAQELDATYRAVAARLPENKAVRFETVAGKPELILSPLDKLEDPPSLVALREEVKSRMPRVDLPEILIEIAARTGCMDSFTHLTERAARATDLTTSLCAVLLAEARNTGPEPFVRQDTPALRRDRLLWVDQNYVRDETLTAANILLVAAQSRIRLARAWGGGDVASADGMRLVVPVRTSMLGRTRSISTGAAVSLGTTCCPIKQPGSTQSRFRAPCATAWCCSLSCWSSRPSCNLRTS